MFTLLRNHIDMSIQRDLANATGKFDCEIAVIKEQKSQLENSLKTMEANINEKKAEFADAKATFESKLKEQEERHKMATEILTNRADEAERELKISVKMNLTLEKQAAVTSFEIQDLQRQLEEIRSTSIIAQDELNSLRAQIKILEQSKHNLMTRANNLEARYRTGDLVSRSIPLL